MNGCCRGDCSYPHNNCEHHGGCSGECNRLVRRNLEPVLVARIYNQPIVEEVPHYGMSMSMGHEAHITNAHTEERRVCDNYGICDR